MAVEIPISPGVVKFFKGRGINERTLELTGIYSGRRHTSGVDGSVIPDPDGQIIVFPFYCGAQIVNEKYRTADKRFWQKKDGQKVFWNDDIIDDLSLQNGDAALVITEGEIDALSFMEAGYSHVVSVPDGAPPARDGATEEEIDPGEDSKFSYVARAIDRLNLVKRIIIAADGDKPGQRLAEELVRRLGRVRCLFVTYPEGCKDANDVLVRHGRDSVTDLIVHAKPYPLDGIYTLSELPKEPDLAPVTTGWGRLDPYLKLFMPAFMVVTGRAMAGKSSWVNQLVAQAAALHGWSTAIASFEMRINPFVTDTFRAVYRDHRHKIREKSAEAWIEKNFVFIAPAPSRESDSFDIDWVIERAGWAVIRYGVRILVIDPWNEVEHARLRNESLTEYTGRAIRALKRFGEEYGILVIVVAHPSKSGALKTNEEISLYDISDSSHFSNKADLGVIVNRVSLDSNETDILIKKVRYQPETGLPGKVPLTFSQADKSFSQ